MRLDEKLLDAIDDARGLIPRNAWISAQLFKCVIFPTGEPAPEAGRSLGPGVDSEAPREPPAAVERPRLGKPALARPIIQKRGS